MRAKGNKMFVSVSVVRGKNSSLHAPARGITESKQGAISNER